MSVIRGRVTSSGGRPRAGIRVYFVATPGPEPDIAAVTDDKGEFLLAARHTGEYAVAATDDAGRSVSRKITLDSDQAPDLSIEMTDE